MHLLVKIGNNKMYGRIQQRLGCSDEEARALYIQKLLRKRVVNSLQEAEAKANDEGGLWKDGYVGEVRESWRKWGRREPYEILFIKLASSYREDQLRALICPKFATVTGLSVDPRDEPPMLARSMYRFPYWDHLTAEHTALVRDPMSNFQPLKNVVFYLDDLELV